MSRTTRIERLTPEQEQDYTRKARLEYGPTLVNESVRRWNSYSKGQQDAILAEGGAIYEALATALEAGKAPQDDEVQALLAQWHDNIRHFYEPTLDILRGLGELYTSNPEFGAFFARYHPDLATYMNEGIAQYVDDLEYNEIVRMLAADEAERSHR